MVPPSLTVLPRKPYRRRWRRRRMVTGRSPRRSGRQRRRTTTLPAPGISALPSPDLEPERKGPSRLASSASVPRREVVRASAFVHVCSSFLCNNAPAKISIASARVLQNQPRGRQSESHYNRTTGAHGD